MRFPRLKYIFTPLLIVAVFFTSLGLSPGAFVISTNSGDAGWYPCIDHGCGCVDAESCANGCCCFANTEKFEPEVNDKAVLLDKDEASCCSAAETSSSEAVELDEVLKNWGIRSNECSGFDVAWLNLRSVAPWRCSGFDFGWWFEIEWFEGVGIVNERLPLGLRVGVLERPPRV